ncbi:MAG TPA: acylneuraminate cytidylyltransferase family protein [Vicinamibacterales bacterium]|nr:acylneuraminate cytidylyltransferase family protein [Vicinamibacterales bacterium]
MLDTVGVITARGASKGVPRKNIAIVAGRPLIVWTIETALRSALLRRVIVSTDDEEIADIAKAAGAEVPFMRPGFLGEDTTPHVDVVEHALEWLDSHDNWRPEYVFLLQPTSPLRRVVDINGAIELAERRRPPAVVSVRRALNHPYLTYRPGEKDVLVPFVGSDLSYNRRQDLPIAYALNGAVFLNECASLRRLRTFIPEGTLPYVMPEEYSLEIDTPWDVCLADMLLQEKL